MAENGKTNETDRLRLRYGFWIVVIGLGLIAGVFAAAMIVFKEKAADVAAVVGSVTGVIGTLVGTFFGVKAGSEGKEKAEDGRRNSENRALILAAHQDPKVATKLLIEMGLVPDTGQARK